MFIFAVSAALLYTFVFLKSGLIDGDGYYHIQMAREILSQRSLAVNFPWLPLTILSPDKYVDHHLLFHIYLIPWVAAAGINGAKLAMITVISAVVVTTWIVLRGFKVRYAMFWALGLFALSSYFLLRIASIRTQGPSLLLLIIALGLMFARRHRWLILVAFLNVWLYDGFLLMLAFAAIYSLAVWISERRLELQPVIYVGIGTALGLVINPYFPRNFQFILDHLVAKVRMSGGVEVGSEWYASKTDVWLNTSGGAFLVLLIGILYPSFGTRQRDRIDTTLLLTALLTLFMMSIASRFAEYFPAFALLFCAFSWGRGGVDLLSLLPSDMRLRWLAQAAGVGVLLVLSAFCVRQARFFTKVQTQPSDYLGGASNWLIRTRRTARGCSTRSGHNSRDCSTRISTTPTYQDSTRRICNTPMPIWRRSTTISSRGRSTTRRRSCGRILARITRWWFAIQQAPT